MTAAFCFAAKGSKIGHPLCQRSEQPKVTYHELFYRLVQFLTLFSALFEVYERAREKRRPDGAFVIHEQVEPIGEVR